MILPGCATGSAYFNPSRGRRADAGAFFARAPIEVRSPLFRRRTSARSPGTFASTACRSMTLSPSTTPSRTLLFASNPTIFISLPSYLMSPTADRSGAGRLSAGVRRRASHLRSLAEPEGLDREVSAGIGPRADGQPAGTACERTQGFDTVFVAVLGMDRFARAKIDRFAGNSHLLAFQAGKMHFDAVFFTIVKCVVLKHVELEISAELAVHAHEQVEIEFCRHAFGVIVGGVEHLRRLDQVDPDNERCALPEDICSIA